MIANGKEYSLRFTGLTLLVYKEEFHEDMFTKLEKKDLIDDVTSFLQVEWALLKSCDDEFPSYREWMRSMSLDEIQGYVSKEKINEVMSVFRRDNTATQEVKKK